MWLAVVGAMAAGCGSSAPRGRDASRAQRAPAAARDLPPAAGRAGRGRRLIVRAGCLACHSIASRGNPGPGPVLDAIGARLPPAAIRRTLIDPVAPMPSYRDLPRKRLDEMVAYLRQLR